MFCYLVFLIELNNSLKKKGHLLTDSLIERVEITALYLHLLPLLQRFLLASIIADHSHV